MVEVTTGRRTDRRGRARCAGCGRRRVIVGRSERCVECWASGPLIDDVLIFDDDPLGLLDLDELRAADVAAGSDRCEMCGCTQNFGCALGCWWTAPGLCSECTEDLDDGDRHDDLLSVPNWWRPTVTVDAGGYL